MILHTLKPRPVLRIVRWVRNQWLLLSFSTFNTKLAGAFPAELVESLQQSHRRGTLDRSAGALGQLPGRPGLPLARPSRSRSDTACRAPEVGGILLVLFQQSVIISKHNEKIKRLAEELSLLKARGGHHDDHAES